MKGAEDLEMGSGQSHHENTYTYKSDEEGRRLNRALRAHVAKKTQTWAILILGLLLILGFVILAFFMSLLFIYYKNIREETSLLKSNCSLCGDVQNVPEAIRKLEDDCQKATTYLSSEIQSILGDLGSLKEEVKKLSKSADPVCSSGWTRYGLGCYFMPPDSKSWDASKKDCEEREAHLVVINDEGEMDFLSGFSKGEFAWIGLTDADGTWKWVDGTPYDKTPKFWYENQPDDHKGHGLGGGEDCVAIRDKNKWNDDHCSRSYQYLCEKRLI